jgi:hypothetical protein
MLHYIENQLIHQKNHIIDLVNDEKYEEALSLLNFSAELWESIGYAYKTAEIRDRIREAIKAHVFDSTHWKTEEKWNNLLAKVQGHGKGPQTLP